MRNLLVIFLLVLPGVPALCQLNNEPFWLEDTLTGKENELYVGFRSLAFHKNDEYYTDFANGQTFFGVNMNPELQYYFSDNIRVDAGLMAWKDFGNNRFTSVLPTFTIHLKHKKHRFLFGNIQANLNHRYIEPLFDFNRLIYQPVETGFQYLLDARRLRADLWVDWQRMIYEGSPFQEVIMGGGTIDYTVTDNDNLRLSLPLQYILNHEGGQIDTISRQLKLAGNGALGVRLALKKTGWLDEVSTSNYFCFWDDYFGSYGFQNTNAYGYYFNVNLQKKHHNLMFSYWNGFGYQSVQGAPLFMSESISFKKAGTLEERRQLLFIRFISNYTLAEGVDFSLRLEPYLDLNQTLAQNFNNGLLDFSNGLYIQLSKTFFATRLKTEPEH